MLTWVVHELVRVKATSGWVENSKMGCGKRREQREKDGAHFEGIACERRPQRQEVQELGGWKVTELAKSHAAHNKGQARIDGKLWTERQA